MQKKKLFSFHVDLDMFIPATDKEKEYLVQMRPSSTFFKDGIKRLYKNKVAFISLIVIILITLSSIILPVFWPYAYEDQLGVQPGKPVDASFKNLKPFEYGSTEQEAIEAGEKVFPHIFGTDSAGRDYFTCSRLLCKYNRPYYRNAYRLCFGIFRRKGRPFHNAVCRHHLFAARHAACYSSVNSFQNDTQSHTGRDSAGTCRR